MLGGGGYKRDKEICLRHWSSPARTFSCWALPDATFAQWLQSLSGPSSEDPPTPPSSSLHLLCSLCWCQVDSGTGWWLRQSLCFSLRSSMAPSLHHVANRTLSFGISNKFTLFVCVCRGELWSPGELFHVSQMTPAKNNGWIRIWMPFSTSWAYSVVSDTLKTLNLTLSKFSSTWIKVICFILQKNIYIYIFALAFKE